MMHAYVFISVIIIIASMFLAVADRSLNFGTVLFNSDDLKKDTWSTSEIKALAARRRFQKLVPQMRSLDSSDKHFINLLLNYFQRAYREVGRQAADQESANIMTAALSDTFGGYLKSIALPVSKYGLYAGIIPSKDAFKLFTFYNNLKRYLKTDGDGWLDTDLQVELLNVTTPHARHASVRSPLVYPCEYLTYYQDTSSGLEIPLPKIKWDPTNYTMYVPLKGRSTVQLTAPGSAKTLSDYYHVASSCASSKDAAYLDDFNGQFNAWCEKDILPHLQDKDLYIAFDDILGLLNKTVILKDMSSTHKKKTCSTCEKMCFKTMILWIILLIEIAGCIPAILYLIIRKMRKKTTDAGSSYDSVEMAKDKKKSGSFSSGNSGSSKSGRISLTIRKKMSSQKSKQGPGGGLRKLCCTSTMQEEPSLKANATYSVVTEGPSSRIRATETITIIKKKSKVTFKSVKNERTLELPDDVELATESSSLIERLIDLHQIESEKSGLEKIRSAYSTAATETDLDRKVIKKKRKHKNNEPAKVDHNNDGQDKVSLKKSQEKNTKENFTQFENDNENEKGSITKLKLETINLNKSMQKTSRQNIDETKCNELLCDCPKDERPLQSSFEAQTYIKKEQKSKRIETKELVPMKCSKEYKDRGVEVKQSKSMPSTQTRPHTKAPARCFCSEPFFKQSLTDCTTSVAQTDCYEYNCEVQTVPFEKDGASQTMEKQDGKKCPGVRLTLCGRTCMSITIDKPRREISVDLDKRKKEDLVKEKRKLVSKIPKRKRTTVVQACNVVQTPRSPGRDSTRPLRPSLIPKLKRRFIDDSVIGNEDSIGDSRLNISF